MTISYHGVGFFGHVWTCPNDRRKGAAAQLMDHVMADFSQLGGKALFLSTDFDSAAYHIYASYGFHSIEERSGLMAWYVDQQDHFYDQYFKSSTTTIHDLQWSDWQASSALFLGKWPTQIRSIGMQLIGRASTEGPLLELLHQESERREQGLPCQTKVLTCDATGAVAGVAHWKMDSPLPGTCLLDFFCHPSYQAHTSRLLDALPQPSNLPIIVYCDSSDTDKADILAVRGFRSTDSVITTEKHLDRLKNHTIWMKSS